MQHHTAVEVDLGERGKGWHYATLSRRGGGPLGDCTNHPPHPTEAEARACYRRYQRSQIRLDTQLGGWSGCLALTGDSRCDQPTKQAASSGAYGLAPLCGAHLSTEAAIEALGLSGDLADAAFTSG